ncbi:argininosuccinate lyase [Candidatus Woesearchaeota archaeon]|nr:argininosuccinate lyase [Candidatus Woesearchaeota archaeon]
MKLWSKGHFLNREVEKFTVGNDFLTDVKIAPYDIKASIAHAKMLKKTGILTAEELSKIKKELHLLLKQKIQLNVEDEDIHSYIENHLTKKLGSLGKKIHSARSRNDQVLVAIRLYSRDKMQEVKKAAAELVKIINNFKNKHSTIPLPGYTHMQKAMPSSVKLWADAFICALEDDLILLETSYSLNNQNPLGSGAGYGIPLNIDKHLTTKLLWFKKTQENPLYCQNSRGKIELATLNALNQISLTLNKIAVDIMLFTTSEFGYFYLPKEFCTGSSIMPQKQNYDVIELVRGKTAGFSKYSYEVESIIKNLPSGYNRDFQLIKEPLIRGFEDIIEMIKIMTLVFSRLKVDSAKCKKAMTSELFATEKAYKLMQKGMPFRDAYRKVAEEIKQ